MHALPRSNATGGKRQPAATYVPAGGTPKALGSAMKQPPERFDPRTHPYA
ncbi:hypothetical protein [Streptomyces sp. MUM 178J]|nr:hypothetical protein [Streptomyces sp. MUM 178J]WRQ81641.1 hypothetical protein I3F59_021060 [Streptomyces sp. MUM 178J]